MEEHTIAAFTEEMPLDQLGPQEMLLAAHDAASELSWYTLYQDDRLLVWQVHPSSSGAIARFAVNETKAVIQVVPANEYYWIDEELAQALAAFRQAFSTVLPDTIRAQRSRNPVFRERYGALVPSKTYKTIPLLTYLLVLIYVLMVLFGIHPEKPSAEELFHWGGNARDAVADGQVWRLFTYMFLHAGYAHLLSNLFGLLYAGLYLEPIIGHWRTLVAYLVTGMVAGVSSIIMHPFSVGVGASGAIFGLYGVFFVILTTGYFQKTARMTMMRILMLFMVFALLMGLQGNTDNAAHIGGLLSGMLMGLLYYPYLKMRIADT